MKSTTLGELGSQLPIGIVDENRLQKEFKLRPFKAKIDRLLGNWVEANTTKYTLPQLVAQQTTKLVSLLCTEVGGKPLTTRDGKDSELAAEFEVMKWSFADVLYVYLYARVSALGPDLEVAVGCPSGQCGFSGKIIFDLNSIDVVVAESEEDTTMWVQLKRPFKLRDGVLLRKVRLGPIPWSTMTKPGVMTTNITAISLASLRDSIIAINGDNAPYHLEDEDIDEMEKIDRVIIDKLSEETAAGVKLSTSISCPECKTPIVNPLNWTYEHFFGESLPLEGSTT